MLASQIGYYSLILGLIFSVLIIPISVKNFNNNKSIDTRIFSISFFQFFFVMVSFLGLIFSFVNSDFSNETVFNNSHTTKPLFYKISGTWGNHEGSLLLWLLVLTFFIFLFLIKSNKQPKKYRILTLFFQQIIIIGFLLGWEEIREEMLDPSVCSTQISERDFDDDLWIVRDLDNLRKTMASTPKRTSEPHNKRVKDRCDRGRLGDCSAVAIISKESDWVFDDPYFVARIEKLIQN